MKSRYDANDRSAHRIWVSFALAFAVMSTAPGIAGAQTYAFLTIRTDSGSGVGTVISDHGLINCRVTPTNATSFCVTAYTPGSKVTLTAVPSFQNATFDGWSGNCSGMSSCVVTMDSDRVVGARFTSTVDLIVSDIVVPATAAIGNSATITARFKVNGAAVTRSFTAVAILARRPSADAEIVATSYWSYVTVRPGDTVVATADVVIPATVSASDTLYAGMIADPRNEVYETDETNNEIFSTVPLHLRSGQVVTVANSFWRAYPTGGGVLVSAPEGISCKVSQLSVTGQCSAIFDTGTEVTFSATPDSVSIAGEFVGGPCDVKLACTMTVTEPTTVFPTFWRQPFSFTLQGNNPAQGNGWVRTVGVPAGDLDCHVTTQGISGRCGVSVTPYAPTRMTFTPDSGYLFLGATASYCTPSTLPDGSAECTWVPSPNLRKIEPNFRMPSFSLVRGSGSGSGTIQWNPGGVSRVCQVGPTQVDPGLCRSYESPTGVPVSYNAIAAPGSGFAHWGESCSGNATLCIIRPPLTAGPPYYYVSASFALQGRVRIASAGQGSGRVFSTPVGLSCAIKGGIASDTTCIAPFDSGSAVTLIAQPDTGFIFSGWSGSGCTGTGDCTFVMDTSEAHVTAAFTRQGAVVITASGDGDGRITSEPAGIDCRVSGGITATSGCTGVFEAGTPIGLTVSTETGASFGGWTGACTGTSSCQVVASAAGAVEVHASFTAARTVMVSVSGAGQGRITSQDGLTPAISCALADGRTSGICTASYPSGTLVTLTATAATSSVFAGWDGACSSTAACALTVTSGSSVRASFSWIAVPADLAIDAVLGGPALSIGQAESLDLQGNRNGTLDLGDVLALLRRTGMSGAVAMELVQRRASHSAAPGPPPTRR